MNEVSTAQSIRIAAAHQQAGRLAEARAIYQQILLQEPDHPDALHLLGVTAIQLGQPDAAIELIQRAIAIHCGVADYHSNLGYALRDKGQLDEAIAAWRQAIAPRPNFAQAHNNLGNALRDKGQLDEAIAACREAIRIKPDSALAYNNLGAALVAKGSFDEAIAACRQALRLRPDLAEIHSNLGNALRGKNQFNEAIESYRQAIRLRPELAEAHFNMAIALQHEKRLDEAIAAFGQAIRFKANYAEAHMNLGNALLDKNQFDASIEAQRLALQAKPDLADASHNMGIALRRKGLLDEAVAAFREAIRLKPDSPAWRYQLAAVTGDGSFMRAPAKYVQDVFDSYAANFDQHLVGTLKYQVPKLLLQSVLQATQRRDLDVLDLGCGTGLCGVELRPFARRMVGVDLSPAMLKAAEARTIYDQLILGDLISTLRSPGDGYDLIVAGDVLIYVGDLAERHAGGGAGAAKRRVAGVLDRGLRRPGVCPALRSAVRAIPSDIFASWRRPAA